MMHRNLVRCLAAGLLLAAGAGPARATTVLREDTRGLALGSSDIAVGRVSAVAPRWDDAHRHIVTVVDFEVSESLKGEPRHLTLTQLGGEVDGMRLTVPGCPTFRAGEEALLFVWRDSNGRAQLNGLGQGKFDIRRDAATGERWVQRSVPGLEFRNARTLGPLRAGEKPGRVGLDGVLDEVRRVLKESGR